MSGTKRDGVFECEWTVGPEAIDGNGHVNNVVFVQWMQDVAIRHWETWTGAKAMAREGATWVARAHHIEYLRPAFLGERIRVRTRVKDLRRVRSTRVYEFFRADDGVSLAKGETDWVMVDAATGRPKTIPAEFIEAFAVGGEG